MKHAWLRHSQATDTVYVVALGWGQDESALTGLVGDCDGDVVALFAWDHAGELPAWAGYRRKILIAWSFGVWCAAALPEKWSDAIAVNGTLTPVDDRTGIPVAHFAATLQGWTDGVTEKKFWRRMGARPGDLPLRSSAELKRELEYFQTRFATEAVPENCYRTAVIGTRDRIFPPEAQQLAWRMAGVGSVELAWPHDFRGAIGSVMEVARLG